MLRRYIPEEPTSRLAIWARRMALFSLAATILSILVLRSGLLEIQRMEGEATREAADNAAIAVITKRKWTIIERRPPQQGRREGHIEAVARTPIMGFRDDVVVRVRGDEDGSRIDVRSSARYGSF